MSRVLLLLSNIKDVCEVEMPESFMVKSPFLSSSKTIIRDPLQLLPSLLFPGIYMDGPILSVHSIFHPVDDALSSGQALR